MVTEKIKLDDALDKACICKYIHELVSGKMTQLQVLESVSSTNDEVMSSLQQGLEGYIGCVTNEQTEGRGRNGKAWESPANSNIYMSIGCHLDASQLNGLAALSLACGVAVARLLYATGVKVNLKWPNDVLFNEKKLAGLLVETRISPSKVYVVVGLGLNIDMPESASKRIDQPWIDLLSALSDKGHNQGNGFVSVTLNSRNELIARLFNVLVECLLEYNKTGFSSFEKDWRKLDLLTGRNVYIRAGNEEVEAKVLGFGSDYSLRVDVNGKEKTYYAADIKLKIKEYADN